MHTRLTLRWGWSFRVVVDRGVRRGAGEGHVEGGAKEPAAGEKVGVATAAFEEWCWLHPRTRACVHVRVVMGRRRQRAGSSSRVLSLGGAILRRGGSVTVSEALHVDGIAPERIVEF
jgi:hypothetical protein